MKIVLFLVSVLVIIFPPVKGNPIKPTLGECPRGYILESRIGCQAGPEVRCQDDTGCPRLSRCCYNGCGMSCLYVSTLVKQYCEEGGMRYHPGEMYQSGCSMCRCGRTGRRELCSEMPNCGQPQMTLLPDGPIESDNFIPSTGSSRNVF